MEEHGEEQLVQDYCIGALFNISRAPENMLLGKREQNLVQKQQREHFDCSSKGQKLLSCLQAERANLVLRFQLSSAAGVEKVVKAALTRHPDAPTVQRVGQDRKMKKRTQQVFVGVVFTYKKLQESLFARVD